MESGAIFSIPGAFIMFFGVFLFNPLFHELLGRWEPLFSIRRVAFILFGLALFLYGESINKEYRETDLFKTRVSEGRAEAWCQEAFRDEVNMRGFNPMKFKYYQAQIRGNRVSFTVKGGIGNPDYDVECWMDSALKSVVSITLSTR